MSNCIDGHMTGFISTEEDTFEITPLSDRLKELIRRKKFFRR